MARRRTFLGFFVYKPFFDWKPLKNFTKFSGNRILAISLFFFSIFLTSCSSSIDSESNSSKLSTKSNINEYIPASTEEIKLYRQIGISYLCLARQAKVEFPKAISIASNNFALIISKKHGGLLEELGPDKLSNDQLYKGSYLQLIEGAIQLCPDEVPEKDKEKFSEAMKKINKQN